MEEGQDQSNILVGLHYGLGGAGSTWVGLNAYILSVCCTVLFWMKKLSYLQTPSLDPVIIICMEVLASCILSSFIYMYMYIHVIGLAELRVGED